MNKEIFNGLIFMKNQLERESSFKVDPLERKEGEITINFRVADMIVTGKPGDIAKFMDEINK